MEKISDNKLILDPDDMIEAIKLFCDKKGIVYDDEEICWQIHELDKEFEGNTGSTFKVVLYGKKDDVPF